MNPIPSNELERLLRLSDLDLDYSNLKKSLDDLTRLAAKVVGAEVSLVNLIDSYTQWSVSSYGLDVDQMAREDSVCQYTVADEDRLGVFEVADLSKDDRFSDKFYVKDDPKLRYYLGIPLELENGINLGALCVLDTNYKEVDPEKREMLKLIAKEVVNRIRVQYAIDKLQQKVKESNLTKQKLAHDIRGPIGGIIGLAEIVSSQGDRGSLQEVLDFVKLIQQSGRTLLELADDILSKELEARKPDDSEFTLTLLKSKLENLYYPQAKNKSIQLSISNSSKNADLPFPKNKLLQILGNLISNSIKFTPAEGTVKVQMALDVKENSKELLFEVSDTGVGMSREKLDEILQGHASSERGTSDEKGYGLGLNLVNHLLKSLNGTWEAESEIGKGTKIAIRIPVPMGDD